MSFIAFEGIDGAGKSTQVTLLAETLRRSGHRVLSVRPLDTALGEAARSLVLSHTEEPLDPWAEALLFFAGRAQLLQTRILPALQRDEVVIADRYTDSTLAYQGGGRGLPLDALLELHRLSCGDLWPELTIYLDVPLDMAVTRQRHNQLQLDRIERSPQAFHSAVRDTFELLATQHPQRIVPVDATGPAELVATRVLAVVEERLPALGRRESHSAAV